jgi:hypothetical protein
MKFEYAGPFKFHQLSQIHNLDLYLESDPDIFLIECEGLHSLGNTPAVLKSNICIISNGEYDSVGDERSSES